MTKNAARLLAPLRTVPLLLTMLALMFGILGMHGGAGGHGPASTAGTAALHDGGTKVLHDGGTGVPHGGASAGPDARQLAAGGAGHAQAADTGTAGKHAEAPICHGGCGLMEMTMVTCVLALALITFAGLAGLPSLSRHLPLVKPAPLPAFLHTQGPRRALSLVQLSISRT